MRISLGESTRAQLRPWAHIRHPRTSTAWQHRHYWQRRKGRIVFSDGISTLDFHEDTAIRRHVKVRRETSPYDGDWVYWGHTARGTRPDETTADGQTAEATARPVSVVRSALGDRGRVRGASLGWRPDEQAVYQPGVAPRALPRSSSRRGVSMTKTRVLRSRMKSKLYVRFCNAGGAGDCPTDRSLGGSLCYAATNTRSTSSGSSIKTKWLTW